MLSYSNKIIPKLGNLISFITSSTFFLEFRLIVLCISIPVPSNEGLFFSGNAQGFHSRIVHFSQMLHGPITNAKALG